MPRIVEEGPGGGGASNFVLDQFVVTPAQTVFALSLAPTAPTEVLFWVNGVLYRTGVDYVVVGAVLTWGNVLFALGTPDTAEAYYEA